MKAAGRKPTQAAIAEASGVSLRTIKRRWPGLQGALCVLVPSGVSDSGPVPGVLLPLPQPAKNDLPCLENWVGGPCDHETAEPIEVIPPKPPDQMEMNVSSLPTVKALRVVNQAGGEYRLAPETIRGWRNSNIDGLVWIDVDLAGTTTNSLLVKGTMGQLEEAWAELGLMCEGGAIFLTRGMKVSDVTATSPNLVGGQAEVGDLSGALIEV